MRYRFYLCSCAVSIITIFSIGKMFSQSNFWQQMIGTYDVRSLAINNNDHIFAGTFGNGIFRSTDDGTNWTPVNSGLTDPYVWALAINSTGHIFAGTGDGVFRSTDNGENWTPVNSGLTELFIRALAINSSGYIFAGTNVGGFRSTDNGENWTLTGPTAQVYSYAINFDGPPPIIGHIFAGSEGSGIFRSIDDGTNWTSVNNGLTRFYVPSLAINSNGHIFGGTTAGSDQGVVRSTDNGENWGPVLIGPSIFALAINSSQHIFAGTPFVGVFRSTDNGANWDSLNSGLTNSSVWALAINSSGYIFAGTGGSGVFRSVQSTTSVQNISGQLPTSYVLEQNYPNPFNPNTIISFSIPKRSNVILKVYDILGNELVTLINEETDAGRYNINFNASGLPTGVYFYQLVSSDFVETKKMMLLK